MTILPDIARPDGASRRPLIIAIVVIAAMTLLRIVYAGTIELRTIVRRVSCCAACRTFCREGS